jgi:hypothetical protein
MPNNKTLIQEIQALISKIKQQDEDLGQYLEDNTVYVENTDQVVFIDRSLKEIFVKFLIED